MPLLRRFVPFTGLLFVLCAGSAPADEVSEKQKKVAAENLTTAGVKPFAVAETASLILCGPLPQARLKGIADAVEKTLKSVRKGLRFEPNEEPWKGKLTVYLLPERKDFTSFMRNVTGLRPDVSTHVSVRGDEPYIVTNAGGVPKASDSSVAAEIVPTVAGALFTAKAGSNSTAPGWVRDGFGRAAALRAESPSSTRFMTYKSKARTAVLGIGKADPATLDALWANERPDAEVVATAFMDYMAYGPGGANFTTFLSALKPNEQGNAPSMAAVCETMKWEKKTIEAAWKKWVQTGMIVK